MNKEQLRSIEKVHVEGMGVEIVGENTPDPLRFAFRQKRSAHAGGMTSMVAEHEQQPIAQAILSTTPSQSGSVAYTFIFLFVVCVVRIVIFSNTHRAKV